MIDLGHVSEQNTRQYTFPVGNLIAKYPDCTPFVLHRRAGTVDAVPVANATLDGNRLVWHFTATDTELDGDGECWLVMKSADGSQKWISDPMPTHLDKSYTVGEAPSDPVKSWLDAVLERIASFELKAAEVKTYSEIAKTYVESASQ